MDVFHRLINTLLVFVILYALALVLRRRGTLSEEHSLTLARLVTDLCLPATIFVSLAAQKIRLDQLEPALVMAALELATIALVWIIAAALKFSKPQQGAIVFCSAFGSSAFLGYSLISQMYPNEPEALAEAILISEIGVGYPIFVLGPLLASYFGASTTESPSLHDTLQTFVRSPIFFSLAAGLAWGFIGLPGKENDYAAPLFQLASTLQAALTPLAILSVGLMFKKPQLRGMLTALAIVIAFKLLLQPLAAGIAATAFHYPTVWKEVLVILTAMPPAVLGVVFLRRFGGDASLASALLISAVLASCVTLLGVFWAVS